MIKNALYVHVCVAVLSVKTESSNYVNNLECNTDIKYCVFLFNV